MPATKFLGLRAFIEGIEVPIVSVKATTSVMGHANAQIVLPATDAIHRLLPRSVVHVFYYDASQRADTVRKRVTDDTEGSAWLVEDTSQDPQNPHRWKLLFAGEYGAYSYQKNTNRRMVTLNCTGFTSYWEDAKIYYGSRGTSNRHFQQVIHMGAARVQRGKDRVNSSNDLIALLKGSPSTEPTLQGLLGGLIHLLESITGVYDRKAARRFRGVSDFMSQAELRLHLTKMIGASPQDTSAKNILESAEFARYIRLLSRSIKHTSSYAQLVRVILDRVFHIYSPQLCPAYIPAGRKAKYLKLVPTGKRVSPEAKALKKRLVAAIDAVDSALEDRTQKVKPRGQDQDPFQYKRTMKNGAQRDEDGQRAWKKKWDGKVPNPTDIKRIDNDIRALDETGKLSKGDRRILLELSRHTDLAVAKTKELLMRDYSENSPELAKLVAGKNISKFPGHNLVNFHRTGRDAEAARKAAKKLGKKKYKTVESEITVSDRLISTLFNPQIWMCPPPKCNVVFPNQYTSMSFSRNFRSEITRLWLHGIYRSGKANYSQSYFSPNPDIVFAGLGTKDAAKAATQGMSFLLPHEKYTGIVPSIQGVGFSAALKKINRKVEKESGEPRSITSFGSKNPGMARAANSKFLQGRYQNRTSSVHGPLNPNLVCGLPALVLDPSVSSTKLDSQAVLAGTHYLGMITSITHSISQSGANTMFTMNYCRTHREGLELFGEKNGPTVTVQKTIHTGPGKKITAAAGVELLAEVYSWELKTRREKKNGKYVNTPYMFPVIGMLGVAGRTGKHVTAGLNQQGTNTADNTLVSGGKVIGRSMIGKTTEDKKLFSSNYTSGEAFKVAHRMAPKKFKQNNSLKLDSSIKPGSIAVPTTITHDATYITGYKYHRKKPWMNSRAIGAVVIDAYQGTKSTSGKVTKDFTFTFEQVARPPWLSSIYLNSEIGPKFYQDMLLCGSLVDPTLVGVVPQKYSRAHTTGIDDYGTGVRKVDHLEASRIRLNSQDKEAVKSRNDTMKVLSDLMNQKDVAPNQKVVVTTEGGQDYVVPAKVLGGKPIETACEELAATYISLSDANADMSIFTDTFTHRGHASIIDMFGYGFRSGKLKSDGTRGGIIGGFAVRPFEAYDPSGEMTNHSENAKDGFHSRAFGPFNNLAMLDHEALADVQGRSVRDLDATVDPRAARYERALAYRESLHVSGTQI